MDKHSFKYKILNFIRIIMSIIVFPLTLYEAALVVIDFSDLKSTEPLYLFQDIIFLVLCIILIDFGIKGYKNFITNYLRIVYTLCGTLLALVVIISKMKDLSPFFLIFITISFLSFTYFSQILDKPKRAKIFLCIGMITSFTCQGVSTLYNFRFSPHPNTIIDALDLLLLPILIGLIYILNYDKFEKN